MRTFVARALVAGCTSAVALSLGSGLASAADPFVGKTYKDVSATVAERNGKTVVATVNGSALELDDCIVSSWSKSIFLDSDGSNTRGNEYRLNLNCNNPLASPGHPGNSVVSPDGAREKKDIDTAESITRNQEWCHTNGEDTLKYCIKLCEKTGICEITPS